MENKNTKAILAVSDNFDVALKKRQTPEKRQQHHHHNRTISDDDVLPFYSSPGAEKKKINQESLLTCDFGDALIPSTTTSTPTGTGSTTPSRGSSSLPKSTPETSSSPSRLTTTTPSHATTATSTVTDKIVETFCGRHLAKTRFVLAMFLGAWWYRTMLLFSTSMAYIPTASDYNNGRGMLGSNDLLLSPHIGTSSSHYHSKTQKSQEEGSTTAFFDKPKSNQTDATTFSSALIKPTTNNSTVATPLAADTAVFPAIDKSNKKTMIFYLSQGKAKKYPLLKKQLQQQLGPLTNSSNWRFVYHSFDKPCEGCIYQPKTNLAQGRNIIVKAAIGLPEFWESCKYLVVFDDDAGLVQYPFHGDEWKTAWTTLHEYLLDKNTTHPLIKPQSNQDYESEQPNVTVVQEYHDTYQSCTDDNFWIVAHDALHFIYPYSTIGAKQNFWLNDVITWLKMEKCFPAGFMVKWQWRVQNELHRYYNKMKHDQHYYYANQKFQHHALSKILRQDYYKEFMNPNDDAKLYSHYNVTHRCTVKRMPSIGIHPACQVHTQERFQKWLSGEYEP